MRRLEQEYFTEEEIAVLRQQLADGIEAARRARPDIPVHPRILAAREADRKELADCLDRLEAI